MRLSGLPVSQTTLLLASILDGVNLLVWSKTDDAQKNRNRPRSVVKALIGEKQKLETFSSGEEFEKERAKILGKINGN